MRKNKYAAVVPLIILMTIVGTTASAQSNNAMRTEPESSKLKAESSLIAISANAAKGDIPQLKSSIAKGLEAGLTVNQLREVLVQLYAYAGLPRSLNALTVLKQVLDERAAKGIATTEGKAATPVKLKNRYKEGEALQTKLLGRKMKTSIADFAPLIDDFLKEHLFADIFSRDVLTFKERELCTIAFLAAIPEVSPQLVAHLGVARYNGVTDAEFAAYLNTLRTEVGNDAALRAGAGLQKAGIAVDKSIKGNPFGLVYGGALMANEAGKVQVHPVSYVQKHTGILVAANVYTPAAYDPNKKYPAIVVAHPNGGVKEQVAGLYAQRLAEQGFITIAFDAAYQGASGGTPRYTDKPQNRMEDIRAAADFLATFAGVDPERLGVLGICGGGGYTIKVAQTDKRFKAVATLSMFNTGDARRNGYMRSQKATVQERLQQAAEARRREAETGVVAYTPSFGAGMTPEQVAAIKVDLYREGYEYYAQTHFHPNSQTNSTVGSLFDLMSFDVNTQVELINQPLLMIAGDKADSLYMTEEVFKNATGTTAKELFLVKGATHIQTYWKPEYVVQISKKLGAFFSKEIGSRE